MPGMTSKIFEGVINGKVATPYAWSAAEKHMEGCSVNGCPTLLTQVH